jgi:hypothetical protein
MHVSPHLYDDSFTDATSCQRLWQKVLLQAWMDATMSGDGDRVRAHRAHAKAWLQSSDADFLFVCWSAGMNPAHVRQKFRRYFALHYPEPPPKPRPYSILANGQMSFADWLEHFAPITTNRNPNPQPSHFSHPWGEMPTKRRIYASRRRPLPRYDPECQPSFW